MMQTLPFQRGLLLINLDGMLVVQAPPVSILVKFLSTICLF